MVIFDTSVWVAYFYENDSQHERAVEVVESSQDLIGIPEYIMLEICTVLTIRKHHKAATEFVWYTRDNCDISYLPSTENLFFGVLRLFEESRFSGLSFADIGLLLLSREYPVVTFDQKLHRTMSRRTRSA